MQPVTVDKAIAKTNSVAALTDFAGLGLSRLLGVIYGVCRHRLKFNFSFS
jgi:hypothetical protein